MGLDEIGLDGMGWDGMDWMGSDGIASNDSHQPVAYTHRTMPTKGRRQIQGGAVSVKTA